MIRYILALACIGLLAGLAWSAIIIGTILVVYNMGLIGG
jgi:hypothetical protein